MKRQKKAAPHPSDQPRTLQNHEWWAKSLRNYDWLHHVAPGATDLDVMIERRGSFLVLECKRWTSGVHVPLGQHIALTQLSAVSAFTVYLVGEMPSDDGESVEAFRIVKYDTWHPMARGSYVLFPPSVFEPATKDDLRQLVRTWVQSR